MDLGTQLSLYDEEENGKDSRKHLLCNTGLQRQIIDYDERKQIRHIALVCRYIYFLI